VGLGVAAVAALGIGAALLSGALIRTQTTDTAFVDAVSAVMSGDASEVSLPADLAEGSRGAAYVALRAGGVRLAEAWQVGADADDAYSRALIQARDAVDPDDRTDVDVIESVIGGPSEEVGMDGLTNLDRGVAGLSVVLPDGRELVAGPTEMLADNTSFERVLELFVEGGTASQEDIDASRIGLFDAKQFLVDLEADALIRMQRGNELVERDATSLDGVEGLGDGMAGWLVRSLADDGRMVYEYYPSRGDESDSNNMIRQWMATIALIAVADRTEDEGLHDRIADNIDYNLATSYSTDGDLGLIADPDGDVKLGAVALAALAISQHPDRDRWAAEEAALRRTVDHLWQADGSFVTFYVPEGRNDNQNFYPGEALLLWAVTLEQETDAELLDRFLRSFEYYRAWHREQPNPAFVPWHSMAYEIAWRVTGDEDLRGFVFEMNDWLVATMQQWESAPSDDVAGRFYSAEHPEYGPPHASSDGVYLEGLIAAYRLAVAVEDVERAEVYRTAIVRGLRHLMQLQFADPVDMYYVSLRDRVAGGLRTTVYDNRIRVDNVQHGLLAVLNILEAFDPDDFRIAE
jgi:hypothetical protein